MTPESTEKIFPDVPTDHGTALIIDDSATIRATTKMFLQQNSLFSKFYEAVNGLEGFTLLSKHTAEIDVVICDIEMPEHDGFKFLHLRSMNEIYQAIPTIIVTTRDDQASRNRGLALGASDYLQKPVDSQELSLRAKNLVHLYRLQKRLRDMIVELESLSKTDALTGVANRRYFMEVFEREFHRAQRYRGILSLIVMDIDDFKKINDTYGHVIGDKVLQGVASILQRNLRQTDLVARYGGEEFVVLLPETKLEGAFLVAERYRRQIERRLFRGEQGQEFYTTISAGVAAFPLCNVEQPLDLIKLADNALYYAKNHGKNRSIKVQPKG